MSSLQVYQKILGCGNLSGCSREEVERFRRCLLTSSACSFQTPPKRAFLVLAQYQAQLSTYQHGQELGQRHSWRSATPATLLYLLSSKVLMMCRITRTQGCHIYMQIQTWRAFCWFYKSCCPSNIGFETRTIAKLAASTGAPLRW